MQGTNDLLSTISKVRKSLNPNLSILGVILNGLLMWDLWCVIRLENWKKANASEMPGWFDILGKTEALNSFANYLFNTPGAHFPNPDPGIILEAEALGHPLIPGKENIRNNIRLDSSGQFLLITGSNMAGKSTFLRTLGVNLVLAGAGAPVLAEKMSWQPMRIFSSMRVLDSLSSRESTFYAELKRLRMIIEVLQTGERILILLDEILKGTNSKDKHYGSEMFIRQLLKEDCSGVIATHDLELHRLENEFPRQLMNHSFEVQIENEEFIFDYTLRPGVCKTMNATELMKKMGISVDP
jgi:DNA mismatch repair ATPase MutS